MKKIFVTAAMALVFMTNTVYAAHDYKTFEQAKQYEEQGNYAKAYETYQKYLSTSDDIWSAPLAEKKLSVLKPILETYYEAPEDGAVYYGAKNEPKSGVYFGTTYSRENRAMYTDAAALRKKYVNPESAYLIYLEFDKKERLDQNVNNGVYFNDLRPYFTPDTVIELAWNTYKHHGDDIESYADYINATLKTLEATGSKILLRFANEMNVGPNGVTPDWSKPTPEEYKKSFQYVAKLVKPYKNIAMVWSPNDVGAIDRTFAMFYPGDEYVDWVGASLYPLKYFQANPNTTTVDATYFLTGPFSHPLIRLAQIDNFMKANNIKKPLMISEGGASHYINALGEDTTDWSVKQVRRMYQDLPRLYPNVKAIFYFNVDLPDEKYKYALYSSQKLLTLYNEVTAEKHFIKAGQSSSDMRYKLVKDGSFKKGDKINLSTVAYYPNADSLKVEYTADGKALAAPAQTPFQYTLNTENLAVGAHTLTVKLIENGKVLHESKGDFTIIAAGSQ